MPTSRWLAPNWISSLGVFLSLLDMCAAWATATQQIPSGFEVVEINPLQQVQHARPELNDCGELVFSFFPPNGAAETGEIFLYDNGILFQLTDDDIRTYPKTFFVVARIIMHGIETHGRAIELVGGTDS